ncbi:NAD(P)H-hydrate dehydratase [Porphyrobacter algicida]|uniref:Bifunctional NAD(P)H-hydrate repair enzyme n=1 Tax=Qipengyuania algicida TaxID=1836209 RepID=A0A845AK85_9SPHN|nr:NAD(P)H-hydrate dehydratase [Qipengyuania algicida]MXP28956.1 NAD(P)H-hydrate dehydratase [Qipengyuania algicida]
MSTAVLTVAQMRAAEQSAMASGVSEWELMERAGEGAAQWVARVAGGRAVTVLCGPGNNGGDGYVIAETLRKSGLAVRVVAPVDPTTETASKARASYAGPVDVAATLTDPILVDCLFGYGLSRKVEGQFAELLEQFGKSSSFKIAIDVPSGVMSDSGEWLAAPYQCDLTLALGAWKRAHWLMPGCAAMGEKRLVDIGLALDHDDVTLSDRPLLSAPAPDSHKYRRGLLAVVAGAMPGAPLLACEAAMRAGAGYVKLLSDSSPTCSPPDLVVSTSALGEALSDERIGAMLVGPGLGRDDAARERLATVLDARACAVIDADALHLLDADMFEGVDASRICLTPHEGELAALCKAFDVTAEGKVEQATGLRDAIGTAILAKGPDTVLACADGRLTFFPRGSSWLSVAGSGDVLAGIIASRLAGHGDPARAAEEGVWLHSYAAALAGPSFTASRLASCVNRALAHFL